jgi:hypothetical protein
MRIPHYQFDHGIAIMNLGDVHRGDKNCNVKLFHKAIETIANDDKMYWVSTGDILNVALKTSLSDCYKSKSLSDELKSIKEELSPIASKCLGFVGSNHHRRLETLTGLSLDEVISSELKLPFLGKMALISVGCDGAVYYIAMHHGIGFGRKRGSKANNTEAFAELIPGADIYLEGHTHTHESFINESRYIDRKRRLAITFPSRFEVTGHYLNYEGSYAQDYKLPARPQGSTVIELPASNVMRRSYESKIKSDFFC